MWVNQGLEILGEETVEYLNTVDKSSRATCCCSWQSLDRVDDYYQFNDNQ